MDLQGKKVLVFGAGISGIGSCGLLEKEGAEVILYVEKEMCLELPEPMGKRQQPLF